jgi:hypothetical protein
MLAALALVAFALLCGQRWLYRHFLLEFFQPRQEQLQFLTGWRIAAAGFALLLAFVARPRVGRWLERRGLAGAAVAILPYVAAVVLALGASELLLEHAAARSRHQPPPTRAPHRRPDTHFAWVNVPDHVSGGVLGGRMIEYAMDHDGHRVAHAGDEVDYAAPSVLFVGESIIDGHGLRFEETIPARVEAQTGVRSAILAVGGYAIDQEYMRLTDELPRFRHPQAVVVFFMPALMHRVLDTDRPHLDGTLTWRAPDKDLRLVRVARRLVPYHSQTRIAEGEATTAAILRATVAQIRARGAVPLILVPQLTPETPEERALRRRLLDNQRLPYLFVAVDPRFHLANNRHPDARGAAVIARAVAARLKAEGVAAGPPTDKGGGDTN